MDAKTYEEFHPIYVASLQPAVRELFAMPAGSPEEVAACIGRGIELAAKGFLIDPWIQVRKFNEFGEMLQRKQFGFTWTPAVLGAPIMLPPGEASQGGLLTYDPLHPPALSIKVSLDIGDGKTTFGDYPPFDPPKPAAAPPANLSAVANSEGLGPDGLEYFGARLDVVQHLGLTDGAVYAASFTLHEAPSFMGALRVWFTKKP
jgi:hypothetical protein